MSILEAGSEGFKDHNKDHTPLYILYNLLASGFYHFLALQTNLNTWHKDWEQVNYDKKKPQYFIPLCVEPPGHPACAVILSSAQLSGSKSAVSQNIVSNIPRNNRPSLNTALSYHPSLTFSVIVITRLSQSLVVITRLSHIHSL